MPASFREAAKPSFLPRLAVGVLLWGGPLLGWGQASPWRAWVIQEGRYGLIDQQGNWVVSPTFDRALPFQEGLAAVLDGGRWGYLRPEGNWQIPPAFAAAGSFAGGLAAASRTGWRVELIDSQGVTQLAARYGIGYRQELQPPTQGRWVTVDPLTGLYGILSPRGDTLHAFNLSYAEAFWEGWAVSVNDGNWQLLHWEGNRRIAAPPGTEWLGSVGQGFSWLKREGRWELLDTLGQIHALRQNRYEYLEATDTGPPTAFSYGLSAARIGLFWGYIRPDGEVVIPPQFEAAGSFAGGLAPVCQGERWGYINPEGSWVIPPKFSYAFAFSQ